MRACVCVCVERQTARLRQKHRETESDRQTHREADDRQTDREGAEFDVTDNRVDQLPQHGSAEPAAPQGSDVGAGETRQEPTLRHHLVRGQRTRLQRHWR